MRFVNRLPLTEDSCYEVVDLELTPNKDHGIIDDDLAHILPWCPNLQSVSLSGVPDLTDRTLILLAHTAPYLRQLDISGCTHITDVAVLELATKATDLEVVKLNGLTTLTDPSVSALARSLTSLLEIELCNVPLLTAVAVRDIWTFSTKLLRLKLDGCVHLTDKAFPYPSRSSLSVGPSGSTLSSRSPANDDPNSSRPSTWLDTLPPLIFSSAHKLSKLGTLDLSRCAKLTDASIMGIVTHAPHIQHLSLSNCSALTDGAAQAVAKLGMYLSAVEMVGIGRLTDQGVMSIIRGCPRLKTVDFSFNPQLTDLTVLELATLPLIKRLSVAGLPHLTDNALFFVAEHCPALERLHLSQCKRITLEAIHVLLRKLGNLEHLSVSGIPALKRIGVERFSEPAPKDGYSERKSGPYRVFRGDNLRALQKFLDKEETRRREAELRNIIFVPRADDGTGLYW